MEYFSKEKLLDQDELTELFRDHERMYQGIVSQNGIKGIKNAKINTGFSNGIPLDMAKPLVMGHILADIMGGTRFKTSNMLFLPASRMGLLLLYKSFFGNVREQEIEENKQYPSGITQPIGDFLTFLLQHNYVERTARKNNALIQFIFDHLIDGSLNEQKDITMYIPKDQQKEIPIYIASSMVNELVPIIKALTDFSNIDYIFYDEVETSLHPLKQIEMVKLLNRLNNRGIRMIISTHSDTMATKINNLQLLSRGEIDFETAQKVLEKKGISLEKEDLLNSSKMHVYQCINQGDGTSIVEELPFRKVPCTGYDFSLFNDSTMNLFEEAKVAMGLKDEV